MSRRLLRRILSHAFWRNKKPVRQMPWSSSVRLSDWARHGARFRYVETADATVIVNIDHVIEAREVE